MDQNRDYVTAIFQLRLTMETSRTTLRYKLVVMKQLRITMRAKAIVYLRLNQITHKEVHILIKERISLENKILKMRMSSVKQHQW